MQPRHVLLIPRDEVERQLASQQRKDVKVVVPAMLDAARAEAWKAAGRDVKPEVELSGDLWTACSDDTLAVCPSASFEVPQGARASGPFAVSFALPDAPQAPHVHAMHWELYYCTERLEVTYRAAGAKSTTQETLEHGGLALFGPGVWHEVRAEGLLLVVEVPSVPGDKQQG